MFFLSLVFFIKAGAQEGHFIAGKVTEQGNSKAIGNAKVQLHGANNSTLKKVDGSFKLRVADWSDSLEITCVGFERFVI